MANWFQGCNAGSLERNGFTQSWCLVRFGADPASSPMCAAPLPSITKEADDNRRRYFQARQPQAKEKSRKSTTRAPISLTTTQSHHPHVLQKHLFQVKQSCRLCVWLCHSDASGKQVCVEYHGVPNATPSPSSFMSKAQPIKQKRERGTVHRLQ